MARKVKCSNELTIWDIAVSAHRVYHDATGSSRQFEDDPESMSGWGAVAAHAIGTMDLKEGSPDVEISIPEFAKIIRDGFFDQTGGKCDEDLTAWKIVVRHLANIINADQPNVVEMEKQAIQWAKERGLLLQPS